MKMKSNGRATYGIDWSFLLLPKIFVSVEMFNLNGFTLSVEAQPVISYWYPQAQRLGVLG